MFGVETIRQMNKEAGKRSKKAGKVPKIFTRLEKDRINDGDFSPFSRIPNLGDYCPQDWVRVNIEDEGLPTCKMYPGDNEGYGAYFVDASGWGDPSEPALAPSQLLEVVKEINSKGSYGFAICERGQFQIKIGVYKRV